MSSKSPPENRFVKLARRIMSWRHIQTRCPKLQGNLRPGENRRSSCCSLPWWHLVILRSRRNFVGAKECAFWTPSSRAESGIYIDRGRYRGLYPGDAADAGGSQFERCFGGQAAAAISRRFQFAGAGGAGTQRFGASRLSDCLGK